MLVLLKNSNASLDMFPASVPIQKPRNQLCKSSRGKRNEHIKNTRTCGIPSPFVPKGSQFFILIVLMNVQNFIFLFINLLQRLTPLRKCLVPPRTRFHCFYGGKNPLFKNRCYRIIDVLENYLQTVHSHLAFIIMLTCLAIPS